jgi:hypothetical protein
MRFCEQNQVVVGLAPYDMSDAAANGDFVSLKNYGHIAIVFVKDAGYDGQDVTLTVQQATAVAGTSAKALTFADYYIKDGTQTGVGTFTKTTQTAASTFSATGENEQLVVVEFDAADLDADGGFDCIRATVTDSGSTSGSYGTLLYILSEPRFSSETMPSAIAD